MIVLPVGYVGRPIRRYVDVMDTTQIAKALMSGMINCKEADETPSEIHIALNKSNLLQNRTNDEGFIRRMGEVIRTGCYNYDLSLTRKQDFYSQITYSDGQLRS